MHRASVQHLPISIFIFFLYEEAPWIQNVADHGTGHCIPASGKSLEPDLFKTLQDSLNYRFNQRETLSLLMPFYPGVGKDRC